MRGEAELRGERGGDRVERMRPELRLRGVRGAVQIERDDAAAILSGAAELLQDLVAANGIREEDVVSVFFSTTADLTAAYPAQAARQLGWHRVALFGAQEQTVAGALPRVIRVLIHWQTARALDEIQHVYLGEAARLRPDREQKEEES